jgi:hypothetical protein
VSGQGIAASTLQELLDKGAKRYLSARRQLVRQGDPDSANWMFIPKLERDRRATWSMAVQVKVTSDSVIGSAIEGSLDGDAPQFANIYVYDAQMPSRDVDGGAEVIMGFPELVGAVGFADTITDGRGLKLYSEPRE